MTRDRGTAGTILYAMASPSYSGAEKIALQVADWAERHTPYDVRFLGPVAGELARRLSERNYAVQVADPLSVEGLKPWTEGGWGLRRLLDWNRAARRIVDQAGVGVVHCFGIPSLLGTATVRWSGEPGVIWHVHDIYRDRPRNRLILSLLGRLADRVVTVSDAVKRNLLELGVQDGRLTTVYNCFERPEVSDLSEAEAKRAIGYREEDFLVVMVGQLAEWKGQHVLLAAVRRLGQETQGSMKTLIVGKPLGEDGSGYARYLRDLAERPEVSGQVDFLGYREDVPRLMRAADVLVHASVRGDPLPTVILEAMASGCCIVASDVGGVGEMVRDGREAELVPPGDVETLHRALRKLIENDELRAQYGYRARERSESFGADARERLLRLYGRLLKDPSSA